MRPVKILRLAVATAMICPMVFLGGCSSGTKIPAGYNYDDYSEFIKLGNYKGVAYEKMDNQVSESEIADYISQAVEESATENHNTTGVVTEDSVINMDYVGSIDGVEFDGGSAEDVEFDIADNNYIDGFAEGIIGHKAGETFDLYVTFPENYGNEELRGKEAVFRTTINYIVESDLPEYNDEWVKNNTDYSTTEEYEAAVKEEILAAKQSDTSGDERLDVFDKIVEDTEVIKYPEEEYNAKLDKLVNSYKDYAASMDMEFEDYLLTEMGLTEDEFNDLAKQAVEAAVKQDLVLHAIASLEGIEITDDEYNDYLLGLLEDAGYTEDSFKEEKGYTIQQYAEENDLFTSYLYQRVMDVVMEYSVEK